VGFLEDVFDAAILGKSPGEIRLKNEIRDLRGHIDSQRDRCPPANADATKRIAQLERELGELALVCRALVVMLEQGGTIDRAKLLESMKRIDAFDGSADGRLDPPRDIV
jgi:hypothetical protein